MKHWTFTRILWGGSLAVAGAIAMACGGGDDEPTNSPTPTTMATSAASPTESPTSIPPTATTTTATTTPEEEVLAGYADYWDVYRHALRNRDVGHLEEVMTGARLERALREVQTLIDQGKAVEIVVNSRPVVLQIMGEQAIIFDEYDNNSYYIDPVTKEPVGATPSTPDVLQDTVTMQRIDGVWKVRDSVREE